MALTPQEILGKDFSTAAKGGFEPNEVRNYLAAVSRDMQRLIDRLEALQAEADGLRTEGSEGSGPAPADPTPPAEPPTVTESARVRQMVAGVMAQADLAASEMIADAERHAARVRAEADELLDRARSRVADRLTPAAGR